MEKLAMCRICLVENVRMYEVVNKSLQELYEKLTDIPFVTEDGRPMLACFICCAEIKRCAQFQRKCLKAEELFAQMLDEDYEPNPLLHHDQLELSSGYIKTPIVLISIDAECQEQNDIIKQELPAVCERQDYIIFEPKEEYISDELELKHLHNNYSDIEDIQPDPSESEDIPLHYSETDSEDDGSLMEFKIDVGEELIVPMEKDKAVGTKRDVVDIPPYHSDSEDIPPHHSESEDIPSHYSEEDSANELHLMEFKTEVEEDQDISMEEQRTKEMIRVPVLKIPRLDLRAIKLEEPITDKQKKNVLSKTCKNHYECDICQQSFSIKRRLSDHIRMHSKSHKCDICQIYLRNQNSLTKHIRTHTGEKPYKCEMCQVSFSEKGNLKRHTRIHTGEKPYKCEMCQLSFSEKRGLTNHIRTHTGEKPYKCEMCQLSFSEKGNLRRHTRIHTGEKPHTCEICQRRFREKDKLKRHTRIHTGKP